jgi:hypothetical protein
MTSVARVLALLLVVFAPARSEARDPYALSISNARAQVVGRELRITADVVLSNRTRTAARIPTGCSSVFDPVTMVVEHAGGRLDAANERVRLCSPYAQEHVELPPGRSRATLVFVAELPSGARPRGLRAFVRARIPSQTDPEVRSSSVPVR